MTCGVIVKSRRPDLPGYTKMSKRGQGGNQAEEEFEEEEEVASGE